MKFIFITFLIYFNMVFLVDFVISQREYYPNLPMGEYRVFVKFVLKCNVTTKSDLEFNLRINKKSSSSSELVGNLTFKVPFDDSFSLYINMAVKDLIGGWKDNAHILNMAKGCTGLKAIGNKLWPKFVNNFGMQMHCPIPSGTYISKGFDLSGITSETTASPSFFYGLYKVRLMFMDKKNNQHGCIIFVCDVKRPWEME